MLNKSDVSDGLFLEGRTAVITGGLSGIGLASAHAVARYGASVAIGSRINSRDKNQINEIQQSFCTNGHDVLIAQLDVCDCESVAAFVAQVHARIGHVDILINSAGIAAEQSIVGHTDALWDTVIETNLTGAFRMARALLPDMIDRGWGRIINIGSTAATAGWKDNSAYCASKAGLLGLTRCLALEGAPHGVSCVMISPTWVETDMMHDEVRQIAKREGRARSPSEIIAEIIEENPQKRMIQPEEVAATVVFLCQQEAFGLSIDNIQITGGAHW